MPSPLTKPVHRETLRTVSGRAVIVTLAPLGSQPDAIIGMRLKGKRTTYTLALSDLYRLGAMNYGLREKRAKSEARRAGISWRTAKKSFQLQNSIQPQPRKQNET